MILLFRQSFISQVSNEKISGIQRIIFSRSESNIEMQKSKSILFFIANYLNFEQLILLGNEFLLLHKFIENENYFCQNISAVDTFNWSLKILFRNILAKIY